jgi:hypothetical protein
LASRAARSGARDLRRPRSTPSNIAACGRLTGQRPTCPSNTPEATAYGRCTTRSDELASAGSSSVESISAGQMEAGLVLMRFHLLAHDGPVPHEVIVEIVDGVVLPLLRAASPRV